VQAWLSAVSTVSPAGQGCKAQPDAGHEDMTIGLSQFRDLKHLSVHWTLFNPVLSAAQPVENTVAGK